MQHRGMRLAKGFVGTAGSGEPMVQGRGIQRPVQPDPALAGGNRKGHAAVVQVVQHFGHAVKKLQFRVPEQIMIAIALKKNFFHRLFQIGHGGLQRLVQRKPDDPGSLRIRGHAQLKIPASALDGSHDAPG